MSEDRKDDAADTRRAAELRGRLVDELVAAGHITSAEVETAFRTVPRHMFAPEASLEEAYAQDIVVVKRNEHGTPISTVSAPEIQAFMLEQAAIGSDMRVLEIGSGGFNAALISELVGPTGQVTTVDIDPDVTDRAARFLQAAGYSRVNVVLADAEAGVPEFAPYDRILVTVGAWDIPPAWREQLAPGGRIVVPLRIRGLTRSLALDRDGDHLVAQSAMICGFVKMQGDGAHHERLLLLRGEEIALRFDDGFPENPHLLDGVLRTERIEVWTGVTAGRGESFATLQLWLATTLAGFCLLAASGDEADGILVAPGNRWFNLAMVDGDSFAYLALRPVGPDGMSEFGVHAFGPHAKQIAETMADQIRTWDRDQRHGPGPQFAVWPIDTSDDLLNASPDGKPENVLITDKRHSRITISWPAAG
ncbi:methyltransferase, FxLD system [Sphaerimonospora cavernae]|uniref:Protein-L-isoaspartate O-methyltransferase n=1 Tax=Sphaerimonospora cavernae TaxID=1740611 RepID=A0ABV6U0W6_9ACTN